MADREVGRPTKRGRTRTDISLEADERLPLQLLERQFDRVQALFPRIDAKINAIFAIVSGQIALASFGVSGENWRRWEILVPAGLFIIVVGITLYDLYRCTFPHLSKGEKSIVYFAEFAALSQSDAVRTFEETRIDEFRRDLLNQTWRTSKIAAVKFHYLRRASLSALASLLPWFWLLAASSWGIKG